MSGLNKYDVNGLLMRLEEWAHYNPGLPGAGFSSRFGPVANLPNQTVSIGQFNPDGSVTIIDNQSGKSHTLSKVVKESGYIQEFDITTDGKTKHLMWSQLASHL
jgi:hypothetical protein